jgi:hypothetical protein
LRDELGVPRRDDFAQAMLADELAQRSVGCQGEAAPPESHDLENLGRVDAFDARGVVEQAKNGVAFCE